MSTLNPAALAEFRQEQEAARRQAGLLRPVSQGDVLERALQKAAARENAATEHDGWIFSSRQRYPAPLERRRWQRTRDIIRRTSPGADEDPAYLEMVARQAASIEMILRGEHDDQNDATTAQVCDRVVLGTLPTVDPGAFARRHQDVFFVLVSAGLIDFTYQMAKATVLAWRPVAPQQGAAAAFCNEPEDVAAVLAENPHPLQLFRATLEEFLFRGVPRAGRPSPPPPDYQLPLQLLTNFNERFILAHEYVHTLHDASGLGQAGDALAMEEFAADVFAFRLLASSGDILDLVPPNLSTQGAFFVLTASDLIRRSLDLVRDGALHDEVAFGGHPPVAQRLDVLRQCYLREVTDRDDDDSIRAALNPARTLEVLWARLLEEGITQRWHGAPLHPIWSPTP